MRPCNRTWSGRFSILRSRGELITFSLWDPRIQGTGSSGYPLPNYCSAIADSGWQIKVKQVAASLFLILAWIRQRFHAPAGENFLELGEQGVMQQAIGGHGLTAIEFKR